MKLTTQSRLDPLAEAKAESWASVRKYLPAIEAGIRALRESQEREVAAFRPLGAELVGRDLEKLEELAEWLRLDRQAS